MIYSDVDSLNDVLIKLEERANKTDMFEKSSRSVGCSLVKELAELVR